MHADRLQRWGYGLAVAALAATVAWAGWTDDRPLAWVMVWMLEVAMLAAVPWWPAAGLVACTAMQYGISSHGDGHDWLLRMRLIDLTTATAWFGWLAFHRPPLLPVRQWSAPQIAGALLIGWSCISLAAALFHGMPWGSFLRHDPSAFFQCAIVFMLASATLGSQRDSLVMAALLPGLVLVRAMLQGPQGIHLESYIATLAAVVAPVAAVGAAIAPSWVLKAVYAAAAPALLLVVALSQNRAAAVAVAAGMLALIVQWMVRPVKHRVLLIAMVLAAAAGCAWTAKGYTDRFQSLIDPSATHATASLDRQTAASRLDLWQAGWEMARQAPLLGVGPGNYPAELQFRRPGTDILAAHSNYVQMLAETGFPGLLLYLSFFLLVAAALWRCPRDLPIGQWQRPAAPWLLLALVCYLAGGAFNSRHDLALAYLVAGWGCAVAATARHVRGRTP